MYNKIVCKSIQKNDVWRLQAISRNPVEISDSKGVFDSHGAFFWKAMYGCNGWLTILFLFYVRYQ